MTDPRADIPDGRSTPNPYPNRTGVSGRFGPAYAELAAQLRAERERQGLSQRELGRRIEVYSTSLSAWERGRMVPGVAPLAKWAAGLGLRIALVPIEPSDGRTGGSA